MWTMLRWEIKCIQITQGQSFVNALSMEPLLYTRPAFVGTPSLLWCSELYVDIFPKLMLKFQYENFVVNIPEVHH